MGSIILTDKKVAPPAVRNAHISPRFFLNKFADRDGRFYVYKKGYEPRLKSTKSQCSEDYYFESDFGKKFSMPNYESWLSKIESWTANIFEVVESGRQLTEYEITVWAVFLATLFLRSRKIRNQLGPKTLLGIRDSFLSRDKLRDAQYDLFMRGHLIPLDELESRTRTVWSEMNDSPAFAHLAGFEHSTRNLVNSIVQKNWIVVEAPHGCSFITSDCPVVTMKLPGNTWAFLGYGFGQEDVAVVLAISPRKLFIASPKNLEWAPVLDEGSVRLFNRATVQFADRAVYAFEKSTDVQRIVDEEIGRIIFGVNAFSVPRENAA